MPTINDLRQRQALPLEAKVSMTKVRIREWYNHFDGEVCVSFSGGKDSTVLAHIVHDMYPEVPLVFANTGLEYPEIQSFARKMGAVFVRPKMMFSEVISKYGYPLISKEVSGHISDARSMRKGVKHSTRSEFTQEERTKFSKQKWLPLLQETKFRINYTCCSVMKKHPLDNYCKQNGTKPIVGTLAEESLLREQQWIRYGCNAFDCKRSVSKPMSVWTEQDVLRYIRENGIEIASVYGDIVTTDNNGFEYEPLPGVECQLKCTGCQRTGCIFCGYGLHLEKGVTRFQKLAKTHPRQYEYCMGGGQWVDNPKYDPTAPVYDGEWKNWNPKKIWVPSKEGLGMKKVFDDCNAIYGKDFIRYE